MVGYLAETGKLSYVGAYEQLLSQFRQYETHEDFLNSLPGTNVNSNNYARSYER